MRGLHHTGYPSLNEARATQAAELVKKEQPARIKRLDVLLTYRCNLTCTYCRFPVSDRLFPEEYLLRLVEQAPELQWLHLSGGEPTCHPRFLAIVQALKQRSIHLTVTSNGTAPIEVYWALLDEGVDEINISLDQHRTRGFFANARNHELFDQVWKTMQSLGEKRRHRNQSLLRVNACVDIEDIHSLPEITSLLDQLEFDDIKYVTISQNDYFPPELIEEYQQTIAPQLLAFAQGGKYPMLAYRAQQLLAPDFRGVRHWNVPRCLLLMDELCCDDTSYYPCIIYFREFGHPIGNHVTETFDQMNRKRAQFFQHFVPGEDALCLRYCPDVTRIYNTRAGHLL